MIIVMILFGSCRVLWVYFLLLVQLTKSVISYANLFLAWTCSVRARWKRMQVQPLFGPLGFDSPSSGPLTSFTSAKCLPFANWSVSKMSEVWLEWHFWASECPMSGDGSTQTMAIFHHTWLQKLLASPSWHSLELQWSVDVGATVWWRKVQWEWQRVSWIALSRWKREAQENQRLKAAN